MASAAFTPDEASRVVGALSKLPGGPLAGAVIRNLDDFVAAVEEYAAYASVEAERYAALREAHGTALWNAAQKR